MFDLVTTDIIDDINQLKVDEAAIKQKQLIIGKLQPYQNPFAGLKTRVYAKCLFLKKVFLCAPNRIQLVYSYELGLWQLYRVQKTYEADGDSLFPYDQLWHL